MKPFVHLPAAPRRALLGATLAVAVAATLAGCGFHRRVPQELNYERIALSGFADRSTMADEIRRALPPNAHIEANVLQSQVVIEAVEDTRRSTVEASTAFGQVREIELHVKLRYRVLRPGRHRAAAAGRPRALPRHDYDEKDALAKDTELNSLYRDLQSDMAVPAGARAGGGGQHTGPAAQVGASLAASAAAVGARRSRRRASHRRRPARGARAGGLGGVLRRELTRRRGRAMQVRPEQLADHLARGLGDVYTVHGDEPLRAQEAADAIRAAVRAAGCSERKVFVVSGAHFDWSGVLGASQAMGLFADQQLIEIRIPSGKPGKDGSEALQQLAKRPAPTAACWCTCPSSTGSSRRPPGSARSTAPASPSPPT
jgi:outer membrane lipopolysaccharide assembly protein LptE/RlpB